MWKEIEDILSGAFTLRANAPVRMSLKLLIGQEEKILEGAFALKVSKPMRISPFCPVRGQIKMTTHTHRF